MTTISSHVTSEGWVRYRRCVCGAVAVVKNANSPIATVAEVPRPR
jgi:hypothetical protein